MKEHINILYIFGDGDRVGEQIESLLLRNNLETLRLLSANLRDAIHVLADALTRQMDADVIMSAGDDLLVCIPSEKYDRPSLKNLAEQYKTNTGSSISFGVGPTVENAFLNLRLAKTSTSEKIVETGATR